MKKRISRIICTLLCCAPIVISAQTSEKITSPVNLYKEGKELFQEKNYAAAIPALKAFVKQKPTASLLQDAEYMLVSSAYELKDKNRIELLRKYLERYPDTPYANRIYSLLASCYFYEGKYDEALALFNSTRLDLLGNEERDDRLGILHCYTKTGIFDHGQIIEAVAAADHGIGSETDTVQKLLQRVCFIDILRHDL